MSHFFYVGQQVECIANPKDKAFQGETLPMKGDILTVRTVEPELWPRHEFFHPQTLRFKEIMNPIRSYTNDGSDIEMCECSFNGYRFRPLVKTDISVFEEMLVQKHKEEV